MYLDEQGITYRVFDGIEPNPTIEMCEEIAIHFNSLHDGSTNATVLPHILRLFGDNIADSLAELAVEAGIENSEDSAVENAERFINRVDEMNESMGIAKHIPEIKEADLVGLTEHAAKEAHPLYPVPVIFTRDDIKEAYRIVKGEMYEESH